MLPTLADVARACGVSVATASKALSPHAERNDVGRATAERIRQAAKELGYDRQRMANIRARRKWGNIGLLWGRNAPRSEGAYEQLLPIMANILTRRGFHLLFSPVQSLADWRTMQIAQRLDGVLVVETAPREVLEELHRRMYPTALINCRSEVPLQQVLADDHGGSGLLVDHLAEVGCTKLVYVPHFSPSGHVSEAARSEGVRASAERRGLPLVEASSHDFAQVVQACRVRRGQRVGVVMYDYLRVPALLQAVSEAGMSVPQQVAVVSCTDVSWFAHLQPAVTAWQVPMAAMVQAAIERLCAQLDCTPLVDHVQVIPSTLVVRGSTQAM